MVLRPLGQGSFVRAEDWPCKRKDPSDPAEALLRELCSEPQNKMEGCKLRSPSFLSFFKLQLQI